MTRAECQECITNLMQKAFEIAKTFDPQTTSVHAYATDNIVSVTAYTGKGTEKVIDYTEYPVGAKFDHMTEESA